MFKAGFFFHTPVEARFFFHKELKVRLFFYSHVSSQRYSHYFQGWGKIIFFATYQSKKNFSTYRLGQIIFLGQKQRQIIFSKTLPAPPPPDNEMVSPLCWETLYINYVAMPVSSPFPVRRPRYGARDLATGALSFQEQVLKLSNQSLRCGAVEGWPQMKHDPQVGQLTRIHIFTTLVIDIKRFKAWDLRDQNQDF